VQDKKEILKLLPKVFREFIHPAFIMAAFKVLDTPWFISLWKVSKQRHLFKLIPGKRGKTPE